MQEQTLDNCPSKNLDFTAIIFSPIIDLSTTSVIQYCNSLHRLIDNCNSTKSEMALTVSIVVIAKGLKTNLTYVL